MSPLYNMYMTITTVVAGFVEIVVALDVLAVILLLFMERCDPRTSLAWIILLIFLPPVGFILYMYMGVTYYNGKRFIPKNITDNQLMRANTFQKDQLARDEEEHPEKADALRIARTLEEAGAWAYSRNNDIVLYTEGKEKMDAMFDDLRRAKRSILMEYYIIRNDRRGNELMEILTEKVREGVEVRLLTDAFGIGKGPKEGIYRFRNAGGHYATFHSSLTLLLSPKKNHRNHRKILIIDGRVAYCGGFNIGDEYQGEGPLGHWRDASVRVEGHGVVPMMVRFSADWQYCRPRDRLRPIGEYLDHAVLTHNGEDRMQLVSGGPDTMPDNPVEIQYLSMIANAKERLYICTPYLLPDETMTVALTNAAKSGVDVRILMPDKKDHIFLYWNNLTFANELMRGGVRVYRYNDGFIHEKVVIMDDLCCSVGSANMDHRSMALNFETNVMVYSDRITKQALDQFMADLDMSTEYSCEEYASATTMMRIRMAISRLFKLLA